MIVNSGDWVLGIDCELPTVETLWAVYKFSVVVLKSLYTRFLSGPLDDLPPSINQDRNPGGSKDHLHISPSTGCYISPENKN